MTLRAKPRLPLLMIASVVAVATMAGCAGQKAACSWGDTETGLIMNYRMEEGETLPYQFTSDFNQTMEVMGQEVPVNSSETLAFSVHPKGASGDDYDIEISIDDLSVHASSPEGEADADATPVIGKSFGMTLSKLGTEGGLPDSETLTYDFGPEGPKSVIPGFSGMFPDLPGRPVTIGDTWPSAMEMVEETDSGSVTISMDITNTLEGYETMNGRDCALITCTFTGTIEGNGEQQGVPWSTTSDMEGVCDWHFDFKEGVFVKDVTSGTAEGYIVAGPEGQTMELPVSREFSMTTELLK